MATFEEQVSKRLENLNESQGSIETVSQWMIFHRRNAEVSVDKWKEAVQNADSKKRLTLLYLANDVLQNTRKKGDEFAKAFSNVLGESIPLIYNEFDNDSFRAKLLRVLDIWIDRQVFTPSDFISNLKKKLPNQPKVEASSTKSSAKADRSPTTSSGIDSALIINRQMREFNTLWKEMFENTSKINEQREKQQPISEWSVDLKSHVAKRQEFIRITKKLLEEQEYILFEEQNMLESSRPTVTDPRAKRIKPSFEEQQAAHLAASHVDLSVLNSLVSGSAPTQHMPAYHPMPHIPQYAGMHPMQPTMAPQYMGQPLAPLPGMGQPIIATGQPQPLEDILKIFSSNKQDTQQD